LEGGKRSEAEGDYGGRGGGRKDRKREKGKGRGKGKGGGMWRNCLHLLKDGPSPRPRIFNM